MKFRKKPVVIEAWRFPGGKMEDEPHAPNWVCRAVLWRASSESDWRGRLLVTTLEGSMWAQPGDWIIQGVKGEVYPCRPDLFEATYERVEDAGKEEA